jgi:hypothetical protein
LKLKVFWLWSSCVKGYMDVDCKETSKEYSEAVKSGDRAFSEEKGSVFLVNF